MTTKNNPADYVTVGMQQDRNRQERERKLENTIIALKFRDRFFIDRLSATGDLYLIPASCRQDWHDFDIRAEQTAEAWPVPEWAVPVDEMSHIEFEQPEKVM